MSTPSVLELASEGRADDLKLDLRRRALSSLYYFAKVVCAYDQISPSFHMPLCLDIQNTIAIRKRGYLWPRGHFKSTIIAKSYPHWRLCGGGLVETMPELLELDTENLIAFYRAYPERDPRNLRFAIVGESADVAQKDLKDIKDRTTQSQLFQWLFPELVPVDVNKIKWSESEVLLPRSRSFDESSITCFGVGAQRTGFHYDGIIYDDPFGYKAAQSPALAEETTEWMRAAPGLLNDPEQSEELIAGTRWKDGTADTYGWLMKYMPYTPPTSVKAATGFKFSVRSCFEEDNTTPAFKERFTAATLEDIRKREGDYRFNCNYRNTPTPPEGSKLAGYKFYTIGKDGEGRPSVACPEDGTESVHINSMGRVSFYDPSAGGRSAACENAIAIVGTDTLGRHFVIDVWASNTGYAGAIERWHELNDKYVCWKNCYEQVGHQKEVGEIVTLRNMYSNKCILCGNLHKRLAPVGVKPPGGLNKDARIELYLEPKIRAGNFYLRREHAELIRQLDMFPNGDLVDVADAVAYAVHESLPFRGIEELMDERDQEKAVLTHKSSYSNTEYDYGGYR